MKLSEIYKNAFENECIQLVVEACHLANVEKKYQSNWYENDFSELIREYINESQFKIVCETERKLFPKTDILEKGYGDRLARIDFYFSKNWKNIARFECYMEAKRLKEKDAKLKRAYIDEGMQRYISGKYPLGCMLGYLLEGKEKETVIGINSLLEKDKRNTEILSPKQQKVFTSIYQSMHPQIGILKHLILDFTDILN